MISNLKSDTWIEISDKEFTLLKTLIYKEIGINLTEEKRTLVMGRLQKILRDGKFNNFHEYYEHVINDKSGDALSTLANRISTNHTFFWREADHFEYFRDTALPELRQKLQSENSKDLRIWCAGCSTGEEPYMLIILMKEFFGIDYNKWQAGILATDISAKALQIAEEGVYSVEKINKLPNAFIKRYFKKINEREFQIRNDIIREVTLRRFNLMNKTFPFKKQFDMIFCRNVMIYFDDVTRNELVKKFYNFIKPGGYLFIGHSETLQRLDHNFKYIKPALYKKEG